MKFLIVNMNNSIVNSILMQTRGLFLKQSTHQILTLAVLAKVVLYFGLG